MQKLQNLLPKKKISHEQYIEQLVPKKNGNKKEGTK